MKTKVQQPEKASRTIQSKTKAANQASAERILQRYQTQTLQMAELDEDELLQGKFEGTAQLMELDEDEELPLQGKFETVQREELDEDELLQGKFETAQREALEEDELLQGKFEPVQREEIEEDEILQGKFESTAQLQEDQNVSSGDKGMNNTGLPDNLKAGIENLSGFSMDDVKVHYNSDKPAQLQALAYAQGTDIHIAPGQEKHLPHEAWHVVQQKQGRVQPTMQLQGVNVNDNEGLEREADRMGRESLTNSEFIQNNIQQNQISNFSIQRKIKLENGDKNKDTSPYPDIEGIKTWVSPRKLSPKEVEYTQAMIDDDIKRTYQKLKGQKKFFKDLNVPLDIDHMMAASVSKIQEKDSIGSIYFVDHTSPSIPEDMDNNKKSVGNTRRIRLVHRSGPHVSGRHKNVKWEVKEAKDGKRQLYEFEDGKGKEFHHSRGVPKPIGDGVTQEGLNAIKSVAKEFDFKLAEMIRESDSKKQQMIREYNFKMLKTIRKCVFLNLLPESFDQEAAFAKLYPDSPINVPKVE